MRYNRMWTCSAWLSIVLLLLASEMRGQSLQEGKQPSITVVSEIMGSLVIIDDDSVGTTPIFAHPVSVGKHKVTVQRLNKQSWFASDWSETVTVDAGDSLVLNPVFRLTYHVQSIPYGAHVYQNEKYCGETPLVLEYDESESVRLVLEKDGYFSQVVDCRSMGNHLMKVVLEADDNYWIEQDLLQKKLQTKMSRRKKMTYLSTALTLASGVGAVWLKKRADKFYHDYNREVDPEKMDELFNKAEQYDRLSIVAFGALQVSFGFSLYFFVKSNSDH